MNDKYHQICQRIDRRISLGPTATGIIGGVVSSPIGIYLSGLTYGLLLGFACKIGIIAGGFGLGWKVGNQWYSTEEIFQEWIHEKNVWKQILEYYSPQQTSDQSEYMSYFPFSWFQSDTDTTTPPIPTELDIFRSLRDPSTEIGQLYRFCLYLYVERFNYYPREEFPAMGEYKGLVCVVTKFHPKYYLAPTLIYEVTERCAIDDLYPYLYGYYLVENSHLHLDLLPPDISPNTLVVNSDLVSDLPGIPNDILDRASLTFRHLSHQRHPREKISILLKMVNDLSRDLERENITMSCDDLLPILLQIVRQNIDILPVADIKMVFDYYGDTMGEQAYIATAFLTTVQVRLQQESVSKLSEH
jgi:hypothetical protein